MRQIDDLVDVEVRLLGVYFLESNQNFNGLWELRFLGLLLSLLGQFR
jgi:hypothetical protein